MKSLRNLTFVLTVLLLTTSCSKDEEPFYSDVDIIRIELESIIKEYKIEKVTIWEQYINNGYSSWGMIQFKKVFTIDGNFIKVDNMSYYLGRVYKYEIQTEPHATFLAIYLI